MEVTLIALAIVVVGVAIDAIGRLDERRQRHEPVSAGPMDRPARARVHPSPSPPNPTSGFTSPSLEKIVVDLTDRDRD